uniref:Uncharacterized protein n=2 Tax=Methylophaga nitratireducenticrescens TaxID=754476 RepID=I1XJS3_METNJ
MALYLILILCPLMFFVLYREGRSMDRLFGKKAEDDEEQK